MRKLLAPIAAVTLVLAMAGTVLAWDDPDLASECAPDQDHYSWKITLPTENNYIIEWSFDEDFIGASVVDFGSAGEHSFTTPQGGPTLFVRFASDHKAKAKADANTELCEPPTEPEPGIEIRKSADAETTVEPGTLVTYTYEVENTGNVPLSNVQVGDFIVDSDQIACESINYQSGDLNDDDILDVDEIWTFTCSTVLQGTIDNEACVTADVGGDQPGVEDCDTERVEVSHSPEEEVEAGTGTPAESVPDASLNGDGSNPLPTILFSSLLLASLAALAVTNVRTAKRVRSDR